MPERERTPEEIDELVRLLNVYHKEYAYMSASIHAAEENGIDRDSIVKVGYNWDGFEVSGKYSFGPPVLARFLGHNKATNRHWFNFNIPIDESEMKKAHGIANPRINLILGKKNEEDILISQDIEGSVWWKRGVHSDLHGPVSHFPNSIDAFLSRLGHIPTETYIYTPSPMPTGNNEHKYQKISLHLPPEYVKAFMHSDHI
jgi:hypothetical protein